MKFKIALALVIAVTLGAFQAVHAKSNHPAAQARSASPSLENGGTELIVGGGWTVFNWDTDVSDQVEENPFTFTSDGPTVLYITDCCLDGDQFRVTIDGAVVGDTSVPTDTGSQEPGGTPDSSFSNPDWSSGTWTIDRGSHVIEIEVIATPTGAPSGGAWIRVDPLPEPVPTLSQWTIILLVMALGLLGVATIRRRHA